MIEITDMTSAAQALRAISEIVSGIASSRKSSELRPQIEQLSQLVLTASHFAVASQTNEMELRTLVRKLEKELEELRDFRAEKNNYELQNLGGMALVYALKADISREQQRHWLCCNCWENDKKSLLQGHEFVRGDRIWKCPACNAEVRIPARQTP